MKAKKITKPELDGDTYLIAQAVNHNAEVLEKVLNRLEKLEEWVSEEKPIEIEDESENKECENCHYNDGEPHEECVVCNNDKSKDEKKEENIIAKIEIEKQEKWLMQAGYNALNVSIAFDSIKRALGL